MCNTKGRARIPLAINNTPKVGDIHKYSANAIERVMIKPGERKPIKIYIEMSGDVGFFQIEEVLFTKINCSPAKEYIVIRTLYKGNRVTSNCFSALRTATEENIAFCRTGIRI